MFQVCIPELIETILSYVTAAYGGSCPRMKSLVGAVVHPDVVPVIRNEGPENLHTSLERYSKGYVVEHAKPWR